MLGVCEGLAEMENVQMNNGRYLSDASCHLLHQAYLLYRACYDRLAQRALQMRQARWKCRPKQHQLEHLVLDFAMVLRTNPRFDANYMGEDMVRRMKMVALASHPQHVSRHVLLKYTLQVVLQHRQR